VDHFFILFFFIGEAQKKKNRKIRMNYIEDLLFVVELVEKIRYRAKKRRENVLHNKKLEF